MSGILPASAKATQFRRSGTSSAARDRRSSTSAPACCSTGFTPVAAPPPTSAGCARWAPSLFFSRPCDYPDARKRWSWAALWRKTPAAGHGADGRDNHRPSRNASSRSGGRNRPTLVVGGFVRASVRSLILTSACRWALVERMSACPSHTGRSRRHRLPPVTASWHRFAAGRAASTASPGVTDTLGRRHLCRGRALPRPRRR